MRILAGALCASLCLVGLTPAWAADDDDDEGYARRGWYTAIQPIYAFSEFDVSGANVDDAWGVSGRVGYRVLRHLSAEVQVDAPIAFDVRSTGTRLASVTGIVPTINARAYPLTGRWQPYGLFGFGPGIFVSDGKAGQGDSTDVGFTARAGAGIDLYGNENWAINLEGTYVMPTGPANDFAYAMVAWGFLFRF